MIQPPSEQSVQSVQNREKELPSVSGKENKKILTLHKCLYGTVQDLNYIFPILVSINADDISVREFFFKFFVQYLCLNCLTVQKLCSLCDPPYNCNVFFLHLFSPEL